MYVYICIYIYIYMYVRLHARCWAQRMLVRSACWCAEHRSRSAWTASEYCRKSFQQQCSGSHVSSDTPAQGATPVPHLQEVKPTTTTATHLRKVCTRAWCAPAPLLLALLFKTNHYYCSNAIVVDGPQCMLAPWRRQVQARRFLRRLL